MTTAPYFFSLHPGTNPALHISKYQRQCGVRKEGRLRAPGSRIRFILIPYMRKYGTMTDGTKRLVNTSANIKINHLKSEYGNAVFF